MKKLFTIVLLLAVVFAACGQMKLPSPQVVLWDDTETTVGAISYEVYAIHKVDDKAVQGNYVFVGEVSVLSQTLDLQTLGLQGDYVIAIRTKQIYEGDTFLSGYAYSDVAEDVAPIGDTFYVRFIRTGKPTRVRVQ